MEKPVVKPFITNIIVMFNNPSGNEASSKKSIFEINCGCFLACNKKIIYNMTEVHTNECLNKK